MENEMWKIPKFDSAEWQTLVTNLYAGKYDKPILQS